jgi:hypothetical protein
MSPPFSMMKNKPNKKTACKLVANRAGFDLHYYRCENLKSYIIQRMFKFVTGPLL